MVHPTPSRHAGGHPSEGIPYTLAHRHQRREDCALAVGRREQARRAEPVGGAHCDQRPPLRGAQALGLIGVASELIDGGGERPPQGATQVGTLGGRHGWQQPTARTARGLARDVLTYEG